MGLTIDGQPITNRQVEAFLEQVAPAGTRNLTSEEVYELLDADHNGSINDRDFQGIVEERFRDLSPQDQQINPHRLHDSFDRVRDYLIQTLRAKTEKIEKDLLNGRLRPSAENFRRLERVGDLYLNELKEQLAREDR